MKRFYKKGISLFLILLMSFPLCACKSDDSKALTTVKLNEVAHSIFYAPMYVAIEKGYFEDEGIELSLTTGFGADKTMAAVVSGDADVGFMGTEASIYAYTEGAKDHVINFAQLTQRAGNFVVARENTDSFSYEDMIGKDVLGGRAGGTPEMVYEYVLRKMVFLLPKSKSTRVLTLVLPQRLFPAGRGIIPLNLNHPLLLWSSPVTAMW